MNLDERLELLAKAIAGDIKTLKVNVGDKTALPTTAKDSIVAAITEIHGQLSSAGVQLDDNADATVTNKAWSPKKIKAVIDTAVNSLVDSSPAALDTLKELSAALGDNPNFATDLATTMGNKVDFSKVQTLTQEQKKQACENIGVGDPDTDFVATYVATRDA